MTVNELTQRIDSLRGRAPDIRRRFRDVDPGDHEALPASGPSRDSFPYGRLSSDGAVQGRRLARTGQQESRSSTDVAVGTRHVACDSAEPDQCRYRSLFNGAIDAMLLFGPDRRLAEANPAAHALLGSAPGEIDGLSLDDLVAADAHEIDAIVASLQADGAWRDELEVRRKDGATVPVDVAMTAVMGPAGVGCWAVLRDISERRRQQAEARRARRDIVAMVGHELMSPLNGIQMHAELLKTMGSYRERSVDAILTSAQQERRLIDDLLELARADAGRLSLRPSQVDPVELLRSCIAPYRLTPRNHVLRVVAPSGMPIAQWDRARIEQVIHNLLSNALKYSPAGSEVLVQLEDLGSHARLSVADRGVGIADDALPHIFERFFRVSVAAEGPPGLGLGLYITKLLVEAHDGAITAESAVGRGSVFHVSLPYESVRDDGERLI